MPSILNLADAVTDPSLAECFTVQRNPGTFASGGFQASSPQTLQFYGTVGLAKPKDIEMVPEADRVHELRLFHSTQQMYVTSADQSATSDILIWKNTKYRVIVAGEYPNRGFYSAIATRMIGQ